MGTKTPMKENSKSPRVRVSVLRLAPLPTAARQRCACVLAAYRLPPKPNQPRPLRFLTFLFFPKSFLAQDNTAFSMPSLRRATSRLSQVRVCPPTYCATRFMRAPTCRGFSSSSN
jgi:hypothetical protein